MDRREQDPIDTTKEIRNTKQDRANAKRKFTGKSIGFLEMIENKCPFMVLKEKFDDLREAYRNIKLCNDSVSVEINETGAHYLIDRMLDECDE